ncbi:MAG: DoxX family protein [Leptospiraceae bacterium]|nr:DoxX family protein [Leptospiraceae bacterium]
MKDITLLILRIIISLILLQTLYFKFTASPESVFIFSTLGLEPYGRILSGVGELVASILLLIPSTVILGAALSLGIISGALVSHLTLLGIVVMDDGGLLFILALVVFFLSIGILILKKEELKELLNQYIKKGVK